MARPSAITDICRLSDSEKVSNFVALGSVCCPVAGRPGAQVGTVEPVFFSDGVSELWVQPWLCGVASMPRGVRYCTVFGGASEDFVLP